MPLQNTVILDLSALETGSIANAGTAIAHVQMGLARGKRVVAVVGADPRSAARDLAAANRLPPTADPSDRAEAATHAAIAAAERFAAVLVDAGLIATVAEPDLYPVTRGHPLDAEPRRVSAARYSLALQETRVLVVPGGVGRDEDGRITSTGDASERLTALFLADRLAITGYQPDPADTDGAGTETPAGIGRRKANRFSDRSGTTLRAARLAPAVQEDRPLRVATIGEGPSSELLTAWLGSLGRAFELVRIDPATDCNLSRGCDADILLDLGEDARSSYDLGSRALRSGRTLITSNTALVAERGGGLAISALIGGGRLRAAGTIAGCPELAGVLACVADWPGVRRVQGTFSPAGDRVLDLRSQGLGVEDAERVAADELGLTPADIANARRGTDAMQTLGAIAQLGFGAPATVRASSRGPEHVSDADLRRAAAQGRTYRIVATVERIGEEIALRVGPVPLRNDDPLVSTEPGAVEAVVETRAGTSARASGTLRRPGSIAAALFGDLVESLRDPSPARNTDQSDAQAFGAIA